MMRTERLILRQWQDADYLPFAALNSDVDVMKYFPDPLSVDESHQMANRIRALIEERGWGFWAVERINGDSFLGFVGLHTPKDTMPFSPCVEIGWRLAKAYWGQGFATEAALAVLQYAFTVLQLQEVVSFTTVTNVPSQKVMQRIGMSDTHENFRHPDVARAHPLCEHVLFKITKADWEQGNA